MSRLAVVDAFGWCFLAVIPETLSGDSKVESATWKTMMIVTDEDVDEGLEVDSSLP